MPTCARQRAAQRTGNVHGDDWLRRPGRAQDDVGVDQGVIEFLPGDRFAAAAGGNLPGLLGTAIGHQDAPRLEGLQVLQGKLAHLAGADDQDGLIAEMPERNDFGPA